MPTRCWFIVCGILFAVAVRAEMDRGAAHDVAALLVERGYENVATRVSGDTLVVWSESRRVRFPAVWMLEVLTIAAKRVPSDACVVLVAQKHARPVTMLSANAGDVIGWVERRIATDDFRDRLDAEFTAAPRAPERGNSSLGRFDLLIGPGRMINEFGVPGAWIRSLFDVSGALFVTAAPGLTGYAQVFVPVAVRHGPIGDYHLRYGEIRPGSTVVSWLTSIGQTTFATMTCGVIELGWPRYDSYGGILDIEQATPDGQWSFGGALGYLGSASYVVEDEPYRENGVIVIGGPLGERLRIWQMTVPPDREVYLARMSYRPTGVDVRITAQWGRFLGGDRGWRLDIERKFGEIGVTIYGLRTNGEAFVPGYAVDPDDTRLLGGFVLEIPLPPRRRGMPAPLRVTSNPIFRWSYRYRVGDVGIAPQTNYSVSDQIDEYNPVTIKNNLDRARAFIETE